MIKYKIADLVFEAETKYAYTPKLCKNYEYLGEEPALFSARILEEDIAKERALAPEFPDAYLESLALFRKLCDYALDKADGIVFHSSAVMVDGNAYLFTAPSGTGKSTHARLWRELLGERAVMVNDDKPIIRYIDGDFYVYGTPWNGKHHLDTNCRARVKAVCYLSQAKDNEIKKISQSEMLSVVLNQTLRPTELLKIDKLLNLIEKLLNSVDLYKLSCNISRQAAELSYKTMSGENI